MPLSQSVSQSATQSVSQSVSQSATLSATLSGSRSFVVVCAGGCRVCSTVTVATPLDHGRAVHSVIISASNGFIGVENDELYTHFGINATTLRTE